MKTEKGFLDMLNHIDNEEERPEIVESLISDFYEKEAILRARGKAYDEDATDYTWEEEIVKDATEPEEPIVQKYNELVLKYKDRFFNGENVGGNIATDSITIIPEGGNSGSEKDSLDTYVESLYKKD